MADYSVTIYDRSPAYVILRYIPSVMPVDIELSDLPHDLMHLIAILVKVNVTDPANVGDFYFRFEPDIEYYRLQASTGWSPQSGNNYITLAPGIDRQIQSRYLWLPLPPLLLTTSTKIGVTLTGPLGTAYTDLVIDVIAGYGPPTQPGDYQLRTTYRDADGYITP